jgi:hypothetical protein
MRSLSALLAVLLVASQAPAQDRDTKVRDDRKAFENSDAWIYNDLAEGIRAAKAADKPLMVVFRCIPCQACQKFDDDVARRDPVIRDLLDRFVCVRIVQANRIDLAHFAYDFDQSFAVVLMNADLTTYGRFGTRSERPESEDISLHGLRKAMDAALRLHADYPANRASLAGKQVKPPRQKTPADFPSLADRYGPSLDYAGSVARSCMHCHQIREAERLVYRSANEPIPDPVLYPYPDPRQVGLGLDPEAMAKVVRVAPGSPAERAGFRPGDEIASLDGEPLLSIADVQWALQYAPSPAKLPAKVVRDGKALDLTLDLPDGWRRGDISWRVTTWDLRRMALGGMKLDDLSAADRAALHLAPDSLALRVRHLGEHGDHGRALRAGLRRGDVLVAFDGLTGPLTESDLIAHAVQRKRPGDVVPVVVLRNGERKELTLALQ